MGIAVTVKYVSTQAQYWINKAGGYIVEAGNFMTMSADKVAAAKDTANAAKDKYNDGSSSNNPDPNKWDKNKIVQQIANENNYRDLYLKENPMMPKNWQVHHTLPQKYESIMRNMGMNIHETKFLRGVDPQIHTKITNEWRIWEKQLGQTPTAREVLDFAKIIEEKYGEFFFK